MSWLMQRCQPSDTCRTMRRRGRQEN
uniref:Uncharacterized protein n=1 Tax=Rhizophora mucronata TaxID=61149 RepID=A0A2P2N378_RHIMU